MLSCPRRPNMQSRHCIFSQHFGMASIARQWAAFIFVLGAGRRRRLLAVAASLAMTAMVPVLALDARTNGASSAPPPASTAPNPREVASGKTVFGQRCAICHYSESTAQKIGPGLKGLYTRSRFADGKKVDDAGVAHWIETGGENMPGFKDALKPAQIQALIAYLRTL
jgi:cytochrome c